MTLYGVEQTVTFKTFLATYRPAGGVIRVVIVKRSDLLFADNPSGWVAFYAVNPFGMVLKEVSMRLGVSVILSVTKPKIDRNSCPKGFGDVASRQGQS